MRQVDGSLGLPAMRAGHTFSLRNCLCRLSSLLCFMIIAIGCASEVDATDPKIRVYYFSFGLQGGPNPEPTFVIKSLTIGEDKPRIEGTVSEEFAVPCFQKFNSRLLISNRSKLRFDDLVKSNPSILQMCKALVPVDATASHRIEACHTPSGMLCASAVVSRLDSNAYNYEWLGRILYLYDDNTETATLLDTVSLLDKSPSEAEELPTAYFDVQGDNLYYARRGTIWKYDVGTKRKSIFASGRSVCVPWNSDEVIVSTISPSRTILMDKAGKVLSTIDDALPNFSRSVFRLDGVTFVAGQWTHDGYEPNTDICLLDFGAKKLKKLWIDTGAEEIVRVERLSE